MADDITLIQSVRKRSPLTSHPLAALILPWFMSRQRLHSERTVPLAKMRYLSA
jgi:hypothetical protein